MAPGGGDDEPGAVLRSTAHLGRVVELVTARRGHEELVPFQRVVEAAGASQPVHVPVSGELDRVLRVMAEHDVGMAVLVGPHLVAIHQEAARMHPVGVPDAARIAPVSPDDVAAVRLARVAARHPLPRHGRVPAAGVDDLHPLVRQKGAGGCAHHAVDHQAPAGRTLDARDQLDDFHGLDVGKLRPAGVLRDQERVEPGLAHGVGDPVGLAIERLGFVGVGLDGRQQVDRGQSEVFE